MKWQGIALVLLVSGTSVAAAHDQQEQAAPPGVVEAPATPEMATTEAESPEAEAERLRSEEIVCRTTQVTGSLTRRTRICATREEWAENARRTVNDLQRVQRGASGGPRCEEGQC